MSNQGQWFSENFCDHLAAQKKDLVINTFSEYKHMPEFYGDSEKGMNISVLSKLVSPDRYNCYITFFEGLMERLYDLKVDASGLTMPKEGLEIAFGKIGEYLCKKFNLHTKNEELRNFLISLFVQELVENRFEEINFTEEQPLISLTDSKFTDGSKGIMRVAGSSILKGNAISHEGFKRALKKLRMYIGRFEVFHNINYSYAKFPILHRATIGDKKIKVAYSVFDRMYNDSNELDLENCKRMGLKFKEN